MFDVLEGLKAHYKNDLEVWVIDMTPDSTDREIRDIRDRYNITLPMINDYFEGSNTDRNFTGTDIGALYYEYFMAGGYIANPTILILDQSLRVRMVYQVTVVSLGQYTDNQKPTESELRGVLDKGRDYDWPSRSAAGTSPPACRSLGCSSWACSFPSPHAVLHFPGHDLVHPQHEG